MSIQSPFSILFRPEGSDESLVLVEAGGWLASLPVFSVEQELFEADGVTLEVAHFRPLGGAVVSFSIATELDTNNVLEAQESMIDDGDALISGTGAIIFQPDGGGDPTIFEPAAIQQRTPDLPNYDGTPVILTEWRIIAALPTIEHYGRQENQHWNRDDSQHIRG